MTPDYRALAIEELLPAYTGMTDAQKVTAIRTKVVTLNRNVDPGDWFDVLINAGVWGKVAIRAELALRTTPGGTVQNPNAADILAGQLVTLYFACKPGGTSTLRTSNETVRQTWVSIVQALVTANYFSTTVRDALADFAQLSTTQDKIMGFDDLTVQDLLAARKRGTGG